MEEISIENTGFDQNWILAIDKKFCAITANDESISWKLQGQESEDANASPSPKSKNDKINRTIYYSDVISIVQEEKEKFALTAIVRKPKFIWRRETFMLHSTKDYNCDNVAIFLKEKLKQVAKRPKKILVLVNPISGKKKGEKIHKSLVVPILQQAEIDTEHIISTHAGHIKEYIEQNDVSSFDSIVVVGGDGTFTEAVNGLLYKQANKPESDLKTNPEAKVEPLETRIGLIPAGTGQGMIKSATNSLDAETAVLHIIKGDHENVHCISAYFGSQLVYFGTMLFALGLFGDAIRDSESNRWMGRPRYAYYMLKVIAKHRSLPLEVSYIPKASDKEESQQKDDVQGASEVSWVTDKHTSLRAVSAFLFDFLKSDYADYISMYIMDAGLTRMNHIKFMYNMMKQVISQYENPKDVEELSTPDNVHAFNATAVKVKYTGHTIETLKAISTTPNREVLNIDGEPFVVTHPEIDIRFHKNIIKFMGSGRIEREKYMQEQRKLAQEKKKSK